MYNKSEAKINYIRNCKETDQMYVSMREKICSVMEVWILSGIFMIIYFLI